MRISPSKARPTEDGYRMPMRLSEDEANLLYHIVEKTVGTCHDGRFRHDVILSNVTQRIEKTGAQTLAEYLDKAESDRDEWARFVSAITIHTTSWFREMPHYERVYRELEEIATTRRASRIRVCSLACSSGQEAYSLALVLEHFRSLNPFFEYEVVGLDIDPVSIEEAVSAVYDEGEMASIPPRYRRHLMIGSGRTRGLFTLSKSVRQRCRFQVANILRLPQLDGHFDFVVCRNVLIYFAPHQVKRIVGNLLGLLAPQGTLLLGHSEAIDPREHGLIPLGNATYRRRAAFRSEPARDNSDRVLIIDQSPSSQKVIARELDGFQCQFARTPAEATEILKRSEIDLITLDLSMPNIDGIAWLQSQRAGGMRTPIVVLSGAKDLREEDVLRALESGAQDFIDKSTINKQALAIRIKGFISAFKSEKKVVHRSRLPSSADLPLFKPDVILIGASTGGPEALVRLLRHMPEDSPPIVVVQHLSADFAQGFAARIAETSGLVWDEPVTGKLLKRGCLYIAGGDYHIGLRQGLSGITIYTSDAPPENRHRPSVDFLFHSASKVRAKIFGILLTGMGDDGARGLLALKQEGALTFCQDEESSVVFGMPKEAIALGAATVIGNIGDMRVQIDRALSLRR